MNKEQTHKQIKKLIFLYEKRISTCSKQWDDLNENYSDDPERSQVEGQEMNGLISEMDLMNDFIEDLKSLTEED